MFTTAGAWRSDSLPTNETDESVTVLSRLPEDGAGDYYQMLLLIQVRAGSWNGADLFSYSNYGQVPI